MTRFGLFTIVRFITNYLSVVKYVILEDLTDNFLFMMDGIQSLMHLWCRKSNDFHWTTFTLNHILIVGDYCSCPDWNNVILDDVTT